MVTEWAEANGMSMLETQDLAGGGCPDAPHHVFLAEADAIGYTPSGGLTGQNDLYRAEGHRTLAADGTILGEYRQFIAAGTPYRGREHPACMASDALQLYASHPSHRLDPNSTCSSGTRSRTRRRECTVQAP